MPKSRYFPPSQVKRIGDRCAWVCGICGQPVDPLLRYPAQAYRSVDHILPLMYGGTDDDTNLRIAHLCCNTRDGWAWHTGERATFAEAIAWAKMMASEHMPSEPRPPRPPLVDWWPDDDNRYVSQTLVLDQPDAADWLDN